MSQIKGKNTKPEILVRRFLFSKGLRYKLHDKLLPGHPDLVFPKFKTVVFVHGCFWHGHLHCRYSHLPKSRREWWEVKLKNNVARDIEVTQKLTGLGWRVLTVWECELKVSQRELTLEKLIVDLVKNREYKK